MGVITSQSIYVYYVYYESVMFLYYRPPGLIWHDCTLKVLLRLSLNHPTLMPILRYTRNTFSAIYTATK